jgi:hypothetical protein
MIAIYIILGILTVSTILQWKSIVEIRQENIAIWQQIKDLAANTAKQLTILKLGKNVRQKAKK